MIRESWIVNRRWLTERRRDRVSCMVHRASEKVKHVTVSVSVSVGKALKIEDFRYTTLY
jgi:hypothetical protein